MFLYHSCSFPKYCWDQHHPAPKCDLSISCSKGWETKEKHIPEFIYTIYMWKPFRNNIKKINFTLTKDAFGAGAIFLWKTIRTTNYLLALSLCIQFSVKPISHLFFFFFKWKSSETSCNHICRIEAYLWKLHVKVSIDLCKFYESYFWEYEYQSRKSIIMRQKESDEQFPKSSHNNIKRWEELC